VRPTRRKGDDEGVLVDPAEPLEALAAGRGDYRAIHLRDTASKNRELALVLRHEATRRFDLRRGCRRLAHPLHVLELVEISLLKSLVLREPRLKLALFLFFHLNRGLCARQCISRLITLLVEIRQLRIERFDLRLYLADFEIVLLQRQQSLNFL